MNKQDTRPPRLVFTVAPHGSSPMRNERRGLVEEARHRTQALNLHSYSIATIGRYEEPHDLGLALFAEVLDGLAAGIFIVNTNGRILHANARGYVLLSEASVLRRVAGRLSAVDRYAHYALQDAFAAAGQVAIAATNTSVSVPLNTAEDKLFVAHVLRLGSCSSRDGCGAGSALMAVFVLSVALDLPHSLATIAKVYGLTRAEMRVMMAIIEVGGVPEVAPVLGIAETTVKTHLQHVYEKIGVRRQADLVKVVAGFMSPFTKHANRARE
jgi:DNA-binding CsgD family transcriptional regulator